MRMRRKEGAIRLHKQSVLRHDSRGGTHLGRVFEAYGAGKGDIRAKRYRLLRHLRATAEAVKHAGNVGEFTNHLKAVRVRIPIVDYYGHAVLSCKLLETSVINVLLKI